jgi:hypothetical protein
VRRKAQTLGIDTKKSPFQGLFENLAHVIEVSRKKFDGNHITNSEKMKWARLVIGACSAYSAVYEKYKLDDLEARIKALEERRPKGEVGALEG